MYIHKHVRGCGFWVTAYFASHTKFSSRLCYMEIIELLISGGSTQGSILKEDPSKELWGVLRESRLIIYIYIYSYVSIYIYICTPPKDPLRKSTETKELRASICFRV